MATPSPATTALPAEVLDYAGTIAFDVEARLLQELGERLVASPEVALLELVKNSSDADAPKCQVSLDIVRGKPALLIADNGSGMTELDFRERWMRIAANSRREPKTKKYGRSVTGQKGIGRFAIRYLGAAVKLETVSVDPDTGLRRRLEALFDWHRLDTKKNLSDARVPFRVTTVDQDHPVGTLLTVTRLRQELHGALDKQLLTRILQIVSPISALDPGPFASSTGTNDNRDPGFQVEFLGFDNVDDEHPNLASTIIDNAWARLRISLIGDQLTYGIAFQDGHKGPVQKISFPNSIKNGLHADIAFLPKRKGMLKNISVDGRTAWKWIRLNSGIGVVDNGFRIRPYGFNDDDWLYLNQDGAHNNRIWRSEISKKNIPLSELEMARPGLNPALNVASAYQVIGAVFVATRASDHPSETDLTSSMDREGFLANTGYEQMVTVVRGGLEYLAKIDKDRLLEAEERKAIVARSGLRADLASAVDAISNDPVLAAPEKAAMIQHYSSLAVRITVQEAYDKAARQRLEVAAGLGVVAGFMTHEAERLFLSLDNVISTLEQRHRHTDELTDDLTQIVDARNKLDGYIRYTRLYTESLRKDNPKSFSALGQLEWIKESFSPIATSRGIATDIDCDDELMTPAIPIALYSGVILNLYTNAVKAVIARTSNAAEPRVLFSAWNDQKFHHVSVQDTGIGIPIQLTDRVFDPFFTTTSRVNSPLGTGMGLGLSLVKDLIERVNGSVKLTTPSPGFSTSIQISFPLGKNGNQI